MRNFDDSEWIKYVKLIHDRKHTFLCLCPYILGTWFVACYD